ncbi:MAG: hypothetical protein J4G16_04570 [Acidobacteria bacterium]|nr:hypothetical protein [Acidobacteriota bacterium]
MRAAGFALAGNAVRAPALLRGQEGPPLLPPYVTDIDGSGAIDASDREIVSTALYAQRGFGLTPRPGFDYRADVFGRAVVEPLVVDAVTHSIQRYGESTMPTPRRPITVAWHYGWYNTLDRPPGSHSQTVRFKGGDYLSSDPEVETTFHDLKNEFGVTVDALSWIPRRLTTGNNRNYFRGFLQAPNVATRHVCLLYEDTLALPATGGRIGFLAPTVQSAFRDDFVAMARFLRDVRRVSPVRIFALDGRPVVFIFGTHTWGRLPLSTREASAMQTTIASARQDFADVYGEFPYLVGEEMQLSSTGQFSADRRTRSRFFDAIYIYHHAANIKQGSEQRLRMSPLYIQNQITTLRTTYAAATEIRNLFTGRRLLVIPNLAPGFAKSGHPTLEIGRGEYANFMKLLKGMHMEEHILRYWSGELGQAVLPAPVYVVGSWNEEFEGHCVWPFDFNLSVPAESVEQHGFDISMALKEVFGWNHYAFRDIAPAAPPAEPVF